MCAQEHCSKVLPIRHYLTALPEVFPVSIVWDSADPQLSDIQTVLNMISLDIDLGNIFNLDYCWFGNGETGISSCLYRLRGMICYYGKHYICFFYNYKTKAWFVFDDVTVKPVCVFCVIPLSHTAIGVVRKQPLYCTVIDYFISLRSGWLRMA